MLLINILQVLEQNKLQSSQTQKSTLLNSSDKNKSPSSSFPFQPITPDEVKFEIMSMPVNKSHGFYSFLTFILKYPCGIRMEWDTDQLVVHTFKTHIQI